MLARFPTVRLFDVVLSLSRAMDLMDPVVVNHQMRTAYFASAIASELGLSRERRNGIIIAGALHDIGAFSFRERLALMDVEVCYPHQHARAGAKLLEVFQPFSRVAEVVRFHHVWWEDGEGKTFESEPIPMDSHILHLADRVSVSIKPEGPILRQIPALVNNIKQRSGSMFVPEYVEAFLAAAGRDYVWLEAMAPNLEDALRRQGGFEARALEMETLLDFARLLCLVVDFKSPFTATHSTGVAASAVALARWSGFSEHECKMMQIAAFLHDVGKLAIPAEILEKAGPLTEEEWSVMRSHVFYTYQILESIDGMDVINTWSSMHQERLNGSGYPFRWREADLPLGARIMAAADVFTALTEERPYRKGLGMGEVIPILHRMCDEGELDANIIALIGENYEELDSMRSAAQEEASAAYRDFADGIHDAA